MTQLSLKIIRCPNCGIENRIVYYASINTLMDLDGSQTAKLLNGTLNTSKCENCGVRIRLSLDVLINCPKGMFYLNPTDDLEYKKEQLKTYGVLSEEEKIVSGQVSLFLKAKDKLYLKKQYQPSSLPPPAPKITPHTKIYNEISEEVSKKLIKNKKSERDKKSKIAPKKVKPPLPPPPPKS